MNLMLVEVAKWVSRVGGLVASQNDFGHKWVNSSGFKMDKSTSKEILSFYWINKLNTIRLYYHNDYLIVK